MYFPSTTLRLHLSLLRMSTIYPKQIVPIKQYRNSSISQADPSKVARMGEGSVAYKEETDPG